VVDLEKIGDRGTDLLCLVDMLAPVNSVGRNSGNIGDKKVTCEDAIKVKVIQTVTYEEKP
jgi:hypothetical protein